jgi:hypothetical protein
MEIVTARLELFDVVEEVLAVGKPPELGASRTHR